MINWGLLDNVMSVQHRRKTYAKFLEEIKLERDAFKKDLKEMMPMAAYSISAQSYEDAYEIYLFLSRFATWGEAAEAVSKKNHITRLCSNITAG